MLHTEVTGFNTTFTHVLPSLWFIQFNTIYLIRSAQLLPLAIYLIIILFIHSTIHDITYTCNKYMIFSQYSNTLWQ